MMLLHCGKVIISYLFIIYIWPPILYNIILAANNNESTINIWKNKNHKSKFLKTILFLIFWAIDIFLQLYSYNLETAGFEDIC